MTTRFIAKAHIPHGSGDAEYHVVTGDGAWIVAIIDPNCMSSDPAALAEVIAAAMNLNPVGPDAVALFRATALWSGLRLYHKARIKPNRAWTPTVMLKMATDITHKPYKRGEYLKASEDVKVWMDAMAMALPKVHE